jgi:hypothetical protein
MNKLCQGLIYITIIISDNSQVRMLEEPHFEFDTQDARDGCVDDGDGQVSGFNELRNRFVVEGAAAHFDVVACRQRVQSHGFGIDWRRAAHFEGGAEAVCCAGVGRDEVFVAPFAAQDLGAVLVRFMVCTKRSRLHLSEYGDQQ